MMHKYPSITLTPVQLDERIATAVNAARISERAATVKDIAAWIRSQNEYLVMPETRRYLVEKLESGAWKE